MNCSVFQVWLLLTGMNELDKNRFNSKHNSLLVNETSVTDSTEEESADDTGTQYQQRKHQFEDLLSASLTLIPQTRAFVRFLTPRAVLLLDQSFFTHWSRERIYPPSFFLASLSWASCMLCRSTGWISSLFYSLKAFGCGISSFYSLKAVSCGMGTVLIFFILINSERTPSIYVTDRNFQFGHRPSLVIENVCI